MFFFYLKFYFLYKKIKKKNKIFYLHAIKNLTFKLYFSKFLEIKLIKKIVKLILLKIKKNKLLKIQNKSNLSNI